MTSKLSDRAYRAYHDIDSVDHLYENKYFVKSAKSDNTYVVNLHAYGDGSSSCSCFDHQIRNTNCKHIRRVAIEITKGFVEPPENA